VLILLRDGNGHGTVRQVNSHCCSSLFCFFFAQKLSFSRHCYIGDNFGLARKATAIVVRVLNDNSSGSFAYVNLLLCMFYM